MQLSRVSDNRIRISGGKYTVMQYHVYTSDGMRVASCKWPLDAAVLVQGYGEGASVRVNKDWSVYVHKPERNSTLEAIGAAIIRYHARGWKA